MKDMSRHMIFGYEASACIFFATDFAMEASRNERR